VENIRLEREGQSGDRQRQRTAGIIAPQILRDLGCEVIDLYSEVDGRFPNHHPDPTIPEYMQDLIAKVKETGAEVGIGMTGMPNPDRGRGSSGNIIWGDQLMILFLREILKRHPGRRSSPR